MVNILNLSLNGSEGIVNSIDKSNIILENINYQLQNISNISSTYVFDPSWFYSAAAQSVAAFGGIIIAFMTTYILTISSKKNS